MAPRGRIQNDSNEAKRWLVVGAFQAGASERTVARISGLSSTAVRQIYLNYRQTGIPSLPKHLSRKGKQPLLSIRHYAHQLTHGPILSERKTCC